MKVYLNWIENDKDYIEICETMELEEAQKLAIKKMGKDFSGYGFLQPCLQNDFQQGFIFISSSDWHYDDNDSEDAGIFKFEGGELINEKNDETWHHYYDFKNFIVRVWNNDTDSESYLVQVFDKEDENCLTVLESENSDEINKFMGEMLMKNRRKDEY